MATSINGTLDRLPPATNYYDYIFTELADPRTNSWFLIADPGPPLAVLVLWMYFVVSLGPKMMKDRKPFKLREVLIAYNFLQVLISSYLFIKAGQIAWFGKYSWRCEPVDYSSSEAPELAGLIHLYFMNKMAELLDTIFFVLRKKDKQISFLHIYHHTVMPMVSWGCTKYYPGGHGTFVGFVNCFVHIIMYSYYSLAAFGPGIQKYLWWKKYITSLQLGQFCVVFIHNSQLLFTECGYPRWTVVFTMPNAIFFYYLFSHFYKQAYGIPPKDEKPTSSNGVHIENNNLVKKSGKDD